MTDLPLQSQDVQISNLKQELAAASSALKDRMNAGLHEVMYNKASFADLASSGLFSGADAPSIPDNEDALTAGFKTYLLTRALSENEFHGRIYHAGGRLWFRHQCVPNAPPDDSGALWWYNATTQRVYDIDKVENDQSLQLSRDIVEKNWADYPFIFEGSVECAVRGGSGSDEAALVGFRSDGTLDMACLSQLDIWTDWVATVHAPDDPKPCLTELVNGGCPVRTCAGTELINTRLKFFGSDPGVKPSNDPGPRCDGDDGFCSTLLPVNL